MRTRRERGVRHRRRLKVVFTHGPAFTVDVGAGGFCTQLLRALPPGTPVEGTLQLGGQDVRFAGSVAWAKPGDPRLSLPGRMGVLFTRVAPEYRALLEGLANPAQPGRVA